MEIARIKHIKLSNNILLSHNNDILADFKNYKYQTILAKNGKI